ncbi:MAG: N-acetylmuramoyl-L-alanine amidase [Rhodothermales bacterium]|nr:N-acetylmuramoyl-L-alanine amidase [Rhodothermales bacterium]
MPSAAAGLSPETVATHLEAVSFSSLGTGSTRLVRLQVSGHVASFSDVRWTEDETLELTLYNVEPAEDIRRDRPELPVRDYRLAADRGHVLVSFLVEGEVVGDVFRDADSEDLLVTLSPRETPAAAPSPAPLGSNAATTIIPASTPGPSVETSTVEEAVAEAASRWRFDRVVIDAGHGGKDPGARSGGTREKDIVLPIALKLGHYLEDLLGLEVIYTRQDDRFIELRERGRIANRRQGDLFISIHANAAGNRNAHGTETFFLGLNKENSAKSVIERENSVIQMESDQSHYAEFDQAALVRYQMAQAAFLRQSQDVATRIEHQFSDRVNRKSRGVKEGNLQVLWAAAMPAVLVEVGFITNAAEARFLRSSRGADFMASAIFRAVRDYKNAYDASLSLRASD